MSGRRLALVLVAALALSGLSACGGAGTGGSSSTAPTTPTPASTSPSPSTVGTLVYLTRGEKVGVGGRDVVATGGAVARASVEALLLGPTPQESAAGLATQIPSGTRLLDLAVSGGVATVDLSGRFDDGGGSLSMVLRVAQVVCTLTQFDTIRSVAFRLDGVPVEAIGGEGVVVSPPVGRADVESATPQVLLESVWPGAAVGSPVPFAGTANTFEAKVMWRVERPDGTTVAEGSVDATSGTGTRGTFDARLDLGTFTGAAVLVTGGSNPKDEVGFVDEYAVPFTVR